MASVLLLAAFSRASYPNNFTLNSALPWVLSNTHSSMQCPFRACSKGTDCLQLSQELLVQKNITLNTEVPSVLSNSPARCKVDRMNGCPENGSHHVHANTSLKVAMGISSKNTSVSAETMQIFFGYSTTSTERHARERRIICHNSVSQLHPQLDSNKDIRYSKDIHAHVPNGYDFKAYCLDVYPASSAAVKRQKTGWAVQLSCKCKYE